MGTVIQSKPQRNEERQTRWDRLERADLFDQYLDLRAQGLSQRQAAQQLEVPRTTLQAWQVYQERLDEEPAVVAFFQSPPGLAFLHRLVVGVTRKNRIRLYLSMIERGPNIGGSRYQPANSPWTRPRKEVTIGEDDDCDLKRLRSSCYAFVPSSIIWVSEYTH
jgi:hypothetical protein